MSGSCISSTYRACPVTLSRPSLRGTDAPTIPSPVIEFDYRTPAARLCPPFPPPRVSGNVTLRKHRPPPPEIGSLHHAAQSFAQIRRQRMPVVQPLGCQLEGCVRIKYNQVRIVARANSTLASLAPRQSGRALGHPARNIHEGKSS